MPETPHLVSDVNTVPMPHTLVAVDLAGTNVEVVTDPEVTPQTAVIELRPPTHFEATSAGGEVRITSLPDCIGGEIKVRVGPGEAVGRWNINSHGGDVKVSGRRESPLGVGSLALSTGGDGKLLAQHVRAETIRITHRKTRDNITIGAGLIANQVLVSPAS